MTSTPPSVSWAQRRANVFLTFNVECEKPDIKIEKKTLTFKGICGPEQKMHEVSIPLFAEVDPDKSTFTNKGRLIEVILTKEKNDEPFWPSLTSDKKKCHWLKVDFNRWLDEDDAEVDDLNDDFGLSSDMNDMFLDKMGSMGDDNTKDEISSDEDDEPEQK